MGLTFYTQKIFHAENGWHSFSSCDLNVTFTERKKDPGFVSELASVFLTDRSHSFSDAFGMEGLLIKQFLTCYRPRYLPMIP